MRPQRGRPPSKLVVGNADRADVLHVPATLLDFVDQGLTNSFADFRRRNAHVGHVFDRAAVGVDQTVVDRHQLEVVGGRFRDDAGAELDVRGADDEALRALGAEIVDCRLNLLAVFRTDLDQREALFLSGDVGELPFVLEPRLFRLLDDEADFDVGSERRGCRKHGDGTSQNGCLDKAHDVSPW